MKFEGVQERKVNCTGWKFGMFSYECGAETWEWSVEPERGDRIWLGGRCTQCRRNKMKAMEDSGYFNKRSTIMSAYGKKYHG